jgi:hypothetical protein
VAILPLAVTLIGWFWPKRPTGDLPTREAAAPQLREAEG